MKILKTCIVSIGHGSQDPSGLVHLFLITIFLDVGGPFFLPF